jgi:hypothetical protein
MPPPSLALRPGKNDRLVRCSHNVGGLQIAARNIATVITFLLSRPKAGFMCIRKRVFLQEHEIYTCCHTAYQRPDIL